MQKKTRRNSGPKVSKEVLRAVLHDVEHSKMTLGQIAKKYNISCGSLISRWVKKYSDDFSGMETTKKASVDISVFTPLTESSTNNDLEQALLRIKCLETMIDIAEKEFDIDIRKKYGTKPSISSGHIIL